MTPDEVTDFIKAQKTISGLAHWEEDSNNRAGFYSIAWPLFIDGQAMGPRLQVNYVYSSPYQPHISYLILVPPCVSRLDLDENERHNNGLKVPPVVPKGFVTGHHFHSWEINKKKVKVLESKTQLNYALPYDGIPAYQDAFVWFCEKNNIIIDVTKVPPLPIKDTLI